MQLPLQIIFINLLFKVITSSIRAYCLCSSKATRFWQKFEIIQLHLYVPLCGKNSTKNVYHVGFLMTPLTSRSDALLTWYFVIDGLQILKQSFTCPNSHSQSQQQTCTVITSSIKLLFMRLKS